MFIKKIIPLAFLAFPFFSQATINNKPFTIPEIKIWKGGEGVFSVNNNTRIVYKGNNKDAINNIERFATDYNTMFKTQLTITSEKARKGDIVFELNPKKGSTSEAYSISIGNVIEVKAQTQQGLYWATRTLLQLANVNGSHNLPKGNIIDQPSYGIRGFMIDCGRKFIPIRVLRQYVQMMSYYKMNTLHIHLNDNGFRQFFNDSWDNTQAAFRLESSTYPGLTARDGFYTKKEFIELQKYADSLHVNIIPEIDVPAHTLAFTHYKPELASKDYGNDHLDLFNPETYTFLDGLFKEYLEGKEPVFRGKYVNIGTDEYSNRDKKVVEKFRYFTDRYIKYIESFGKKAMAWGQQTHAKGQTPIKVKDVLMQIWSSQYADPKEMINLGYDVVSIPDGWVYIVPQAGYYYDYLNTKMLYNKWTPAQLGSKDSFPENHPQIKGGMFAVWNDHVGNGITTQDIHYRVLPAMQTISTKTWYGANPTFKFEEFDTKRLDIAEAPGLNAAGKYAKGVVLEQKQVEPNQMLSIDQIGWNYEVSFDVDYKQEPLGTVLFSSDDAKFYLTDPVRGFIGFSSDGYLNDFGYQLLPNEKVHIAIKGNREETCLYINGKLFKRLDVNKTPAKGNQMRKSRTLVFPLKHTGTNFNSIITNLKVVSL